MQAFDSLGSDSQQCVLDVAARLESAAVGIDVDVAHGLLDADAAARGASGVGVQDVDKLGVISRQSVLNVSVFEAGTCRIKTYRERESEMD